MFSTSQSFPGIPQIGNNVDRVSRRSQSINRASSIVSNERSLATTVCATIHTATTPLDRFYHSLHYRTLTGHWKLFSAKSFVGDKEASVFVFEKKQNVKAAPRIGRLNRLTLVDLLKYEVTQLSSLVHPRILHLLHGVEETKDMLGFAAERVLGSLETIVKDGLLKSIEIKLGVLQIIDGLSYLHNSAKILHGNLTPSAIYVTSSRLWKISGFAFSVFAIDSNTFPCFPWTKKLHVSLQPDLDFLAPEYVRPNQKTVTCAADVFSLGVLICWIIAGGKRLIDARSSLDTYTVICGQLDEALDLMSEQLGPNLLEAMHKVLSHDVDRRPTVQLLALIKYFDDSAVSALRKLDDIAQEFDPTHKNFFLSQTLYNSLPSIPEDLWFTRILQRFNEHLVDSVELYGAIARPLFYILDKCETENVQLLRPWMRRITEPSEQKSLTPLILENMKNLLERLCDDHVEGFVLDLLIDSIKSDDKHTQGHAIRSIPPICPNISRQFITQRLLPAFSSLSSFLQGNVSRQLDLLNSIGALSDVCDSTILDLLIPTVSLCNMNHPAIIHAKSRLVQRIVAYDSNRLQDAKVICNHLLNPLSLGLGHPDLVNGHFEDVISSVRLLVDLVEQLKYETEDGLRKLSIVSGGSRIGNKRVSLSSSHLPRVMITAARPCCPGCDKRKMSFLSADGRLEDRGRNEFKDSRGSLESDLSSRIGTASDDDQYVSHPTARRSSWLDGCGGSAEHNLQRDSLTLDRSLSACQKANFDQSQSFGRLRTRSPGTTGSITSGISKTHPSRPNSFTNLGHNLACTLWKTFY